MISKNTEIRINIDTLSVTDNGTDTTTVTYDGVLYLKPDGIYVMYTDNEPCTIKQKTNTVRVLRHHSKSSMTFETGKKHPSTLNTPMGPIPVEIDTLAVSGDLDSKLEIIYHIIYNNAVMTRNTVNIKIEEK